MRLRPRDRRWYELPLRFGHERGRSIPASDQSSVGNGMEWRPKRSDADQPGACIKHSGKAVNFGGLKLFVKDNGGKIVGMCLASMVLLEPGGPIIRILCPPAAGGLERTFGGVLAAYIFEVHGKLLGLAEQMFAVHNQWLNAVTRVHKTNYIQQRFHQIDRSTLHHGGLFGIQFRHNEPGDLSRTSFNGSGCAPRTPRIPPSNDNSPTNRQSGTHFLF
jgi:hypothetical protein